MIGLRSIRSKFNIKYRFLNYMAYPNQVLMNALKCFNETKHTMLINYGLPLNDIRKLQLHVSECGRFYKLQQVINHNIITELQLRQLLDYLKNELEQNRATDLSKLLKTSSCMNDIHSCVGIDISPNEIAYCSIDSHFNVNDMRYISLDINFQDFNMVTEQICDVVDKLPMANLYIIEKQPTTLQRTTKQTNFLYFYIMEYLVHTALLTRFNTDSEKDNATTTPQIITMSEKEMCLLTGLPNMQSQKEYICKIVTNDTFYYSEVIRSVNLMKLNERRHVDSESMYNARNISTQYLVDNAVLSIFLPAYFELLLKDNPTLIEFTEFFHCFNVPDHLKLYYGNLPIKHDVGDAFWLAASYWFAIKKTNPAFYDSLPRNNIVMLP